MKNKQTNETSKTVSSLLWGYYGILYKKHLVQCLAQRIQSTDIFVIIVINITMEVQLLSLKTVGERDSSNK